MGQSDLEVLKRLAEIAERLSRLEGRYPEAFTVLEAAKRLGIGKTLMRQLIATREIQTVPIGGREKVPSTEIARLLTPSLAPARMTPRAERPKRKKASARVSMEAELAKLDAVAKARRKKRT